MPSTARCCAARAPRSSRRSRVAPAPGRGARRPPATRCPIPYVPIPPTPVSGGATVGRIDPEFSFTSSDPDIGDFVAVDPTSGNPRDVLLGADDKPVSDARSGLFCAFNAGTTTITVRTGGLAYSQKVTIQAGSVDRPCGTVPLSAARFTAPAAAAGIAAAGARSGAGGRLVATAARAAPAGGRRAAGEVARGEDARRPRRRSSAGCSRPRRATSPRPPCSRPCRLRGSSRTRSRPAAPPCACRRRSARRRSHPSRPPPPCATSRTRRTSCATGP